MANEIEVEIVGKLDSINRSLDELEKTAKEKGSAVGAGVVAGITASITTLGLKAVGALGSKLVDTFEKSIEEASQADKALQLFNSSLAAAGNFSKQASLDFQEFASGLQKVTGVSDDLITSNASILASLGRLSGEGLERASEAAVNFAATGRVSLEGAFDAIAKAAAGNVGALSRYGIKVDENIPKSERFAAALGQLEQRFGGLAAAQVNTFAGSLELLSVNFNDILENLGKAVTQSPAVVAVIKEMGKVFGEFAENIKKLAGQDFVGGLVKQFLQLGQTLITWVIAPMELGFNISKTFVSALTTGFLTITAAVLELAGSMAFLFDKILKTGLSEMVAKFQEEVEGKLLTSAKNTGDNFKNIMDFSFSGSVSNFITRLQDAAATAGPVMSSITNSVTTAAQESSAAVEAAAKKISQTIQQGVINTISVGIQTVGASLVRGAKAFDSFKNLVLSIIGDMAIQIGNTMIALGLSIEKLKVALTSLSGGVLIAAGIALVALGGALKAMSGGAADGGGVGVGGGVGTGPGGPAVGGGSFGTQPDLVAAQQGTNVAVNIQGNVLDRRETGLEIANVIQEHFNNNGNLIAGATV